MKKLASLLMAVMFLASLVLVSCGQSGGDGSSSSQSSSKTYGDFKAACIVDTIGDKSFADAAWNGFKDLKADYGIETKLVETQGDATRYEPTLQSLGEDGYDFVAADGTAKLEILERIAQYYPDTLFLSYDIDSGYENKMPNVAVITYAQNESSYLCGIVSAPLSKTGVLGFLGGQITPLIDDFLMGYITGSQEVNEDIKIVINYVGSWTDAAKAKELTNVMIGQNADVIHGVAWTAGIGAIEAVSVSDKVDYYVGVDSDQWYELKDNRPDLAEKIVTSALKQVGETLYKAVEDILAAREEEKIPEYFGESVIWGIKEHGSGIARNENYEKLVPENVRKMVDEAEQKVRDGQFKVPTAYGMSQTEIDAIKDSVKP